MAHYISLVRYTQKGIENIKQSPSRLDAAKKAFESAGGKFHAWYLTMGRYDAVLISVMSRFGLLAAFLLFAAVSGRADSGCVAFVASPDSYSAPAGGTFTVFTTFSNCTPDQYIYIGDSFGSDESVNISSNWLFDPTFDLAPGQSTTAAFGSYTWDPNAPGGFVWNPNINAVFFFYTALCDPGTDTCAGVGTFERTSFTATVEQPVPEPATLLLLGTGGFGLLVKARRRRRTQAER